MAKIKQIPYSHQSIGNDDIREVIKVLKSGWITQGPKIKEFEDALCRYTGAKYAVAVCNGTAALHLACLSAGIGPGDEVITTPLTFVASANCVVYVGAKPVFADIDSDGFNIDLDQVRKKLTKKTKAIIPVHFSGFPYRSEELYKIARKNRVMIIEDACHALGAEYKFNNKWLKIGCCQHSDMAVFSFHPVKSITTGEGAAITTNRKDIYEKLLMLRSHGITKEHTTLKKQASDNEGLNSGRKNNDSQAPWYYEMQMLGYNYRITDIQCALGLTQLKKINGFMEKRRQIAGYYNERFAGPVGFYVPQTSSDRKSACHLYVIRLKLDKITKTRREIFEELRSLGLGVQIHYVPVHLQPYYRDRFGYKRGDFPNAEQYYDAVISIPLYPGLTKKDQVRIVNAVFKTVN